MTVSFSDVIGLVGLAVSVGGFWIALAQIRKTTTAAESARDAAKLAKDGIGRLDSLISFASVAKTVDEIKDTFRSGSFDRLPNLFDQARKSLIAARESHPNLETSDQAKIQKTLTFFTELELDLADSSNEVIVTKRSKYTKSLIQISDDIVTITSRMKVSGDR
ncbi:hypothetical protein [Mesorhizobium marinum]|uniref:Chemotaxis protein n=1 Tax=Mesorhizobium marinum TaxID=3228790 RepID=A0ABV3QWH5_9HYPH